MTAARNVMVFWERWPKARAKFEAEMAAGRRGPAFSRLQREVGYLDKHMGWDISPGTTATNALVLRPRGDADRRAVAQRWLASAPAADASWEFGVGLPPRLVTETVEFVTIDGEHVLVGDILDHFHAEADADYLAGHPDAAEEQMLRDFAKDAGIDLKVTTIALADIQVSPQWDEDFERVDVALWHPGFARLSRVEAADLGVPAIEALLGDEVVDRWVGSITVDRHVRDGLRLTELPAWIEAKTQHATGDRWITVPRLDQHRRRVGVRYNAARKTLDEPVEQPGLLVVVQRDVADVLAPEPAPVADAIDELLAALAPGALLLVEVSEARRLSLVWLTSDAKADRRAAIAWGKRHRAFDVDVDVDPKARWLDQMGVAGVWREQPAASDTAPRVKTRPDGRVYRAARRIERHPRQVLLLPILLAIAAIAIGIAVPSMARDAALQLLGAAGLVGLGIATYMTASTYVTFRDNPALGCLAVLIDGWRIIVITVVSLVLISIFVNGFTPT